MFICDITKQCSVSCQKPIIVIDEKRKRSYNGNSSFGWEIIKELKLSSEGFAIWQRRQPADEGSMKEQIQKLGFSDA